MKLSFLNDERDNTARLVECEWADLVEDLTRVRRTACACHVVCASCAGTGKHPAKGTPCKACDGTGARAAGRSNDCRLKSGIAWCPCEFKDGVRAKSNVLNTWALVLDLDHQPLAELDLVTKGIEAAGLDYVLHTTHSHRLEPDDACARVIFPLDRPVTAKEFPRLREAACSMLGIHADPRAKDPSRLFYLPSAPKEGPFLGYHVPGIPLPVEDLLAYQGSPVLASVPAPAAVVVADGPADMAALRETLKRVKDEKSRELVMKAMKGEVIAEEGARDDTLHKLMSILAFSLPTTTPSEAMLELVRPGIMLMPGDPPEGKGSWMEMAAAKLERARSDRLASDERKVKWNAEVRARLGVSAASDDAEVVAAQDVAGEVAANEDPTQPYTEERILEWAKEAGCSREEWNKRWIITTGTAFWVWREGRYLPPISKEALDVCMERDLARAPVKIKIENENTGNFHRRKTKEILADYARVARRTEADLVLQKSYFDSATETFREAVCPLRPIEAVFNPKIQEWLEMVGGDQKEQLLDWVATLTQLDRQTCALYLHAGPGVGKTLLATGLARLWTRGGPSALEDVLSGFNDTLVNCPLVFADENLPEKFRHATTLLRKIIGQSVRPLNRKFLPTSQLRGSLRLILAANNDRLLETGEELSPEDLAAVSSRFLYLDPIKRSEEISNYLLDVTPASITREWLDGDGIAQHAVWLAQNRAVQSMGRFLVEGNRRSFHEQLVTASGAVGQVTEVIVGALFHPSGQRFRADERIQIGGGHLWVSTAYISAYWADFVRGRPCPTTTSIGTALRNLSYGSIQLPSPRGNKHIYWRLRPGLISAWMRRTSFGDPEAFDRMVRAPCDFVASACERHPGKAAMLAEEAAEVVRTMPAGQC